MPSLQAKRSNKVLKRCQPNKIPQPNLICRPNYGAPYLGACFCRAAVTALLTTV